MMQGNCWWRGPGYFFGGPLSIIVGILFWAIILYGIIYLISYMTRGPFRENAGVETPLDILKKRYARGEIDADEFAQRRKALES